MTINPVPLLVLAAFALLAARSERDRPRRPRRNPRDRGGPVCGTFFRITRRARAVPGDFESNRARGRNPRRGELYDPELHDGLSVFRDPEHAHAMGRNFPRLGGYVQGVAIPRGSSITGRKTPSRYSSHWTLWGAPGEFLRYLSGPAVAV